MESSKNCFQLILYPYSRVNSLEENSKNLIERVRDGEESAFGLMFEQSHQFILKFIYGMVGDRELAEELTQETFMGAYKNKHLLRGDSKLSTWLCGIAKNIISNSFRARRGEYMTVDIDEVSLLKLRENNPAPDQQLLSEEFNNVVRISLLQLDENRRVVFVLKIFQQLSYEEISEITGSSVSKLKTDLCRARAEVRRLIRPYLEERKQ